MDTKIIQYPSDPTDCITRLGVFVDILASMPPKRIIDEGLPVIIALTAITMKLALLSQDLLTEIRK